MFIWVGTFFLETQPSGRRYVYLGRYVFEKLPRRGGGTLIWGGSFIWQWIVSTLFLKPLKKYVLD